MALPTPEQMTGPNVTEAQFKNGLIDLLNSILSKQEINGNALFKPVALTRESNLNDLKVNGLYYLTYSEYASFANNFPALAGGVLYVQNRLAGLVHQTYTSSNNIFIRSLSGETWGTWKKLINEANLDSFGQGLVSQLQQDTEMKINNLQSESIAPIVDELASINIYADVASNQFDFAISDLQGNTTLGIEKDGGLWANHLSSDQIDIADDSIQALTSKEYAYAVTDQNGNVAFAIKNNGEVVFKGVETKEINLKPIKTDWIHGNTYGQSLSRGSGSYPVVSTIQPYSNLTFSSGVLPRLSDLHDYSDVKPLVEQRWNASGAEGESPTSGMLNKISELYLAKGEQYTFFGASSGQGGTRLELLSKGTTRYSEQIEMYKAAYSLAQDRGFSYSVGVIGFVQGESNYNADTGRDEYKSLMVQLKRDFDLDIKQITNQDFSPIMVTYQTASHFVASPRRDHTNIALAQLDAHRENADIVMACAMYAMQYLSDNLHLTADSSLQLGKYLGKAAYQTMQYLNGEVKEPFRPVEPDQVIWQGKIIDITFNVPVGQLTIDTTLVSETHNYGFDVWVGDSVQDQAIKSVSIIDKNRVRIILNQSYENAVLSYARGRPTDPIASGSISGPRGNIRDQAGEYDSYQDSKGVTRYMHNWCVIFQYSQTKGFN